MLERSSNLDCALSSDNVLVAKNARGPSFKGSSPGIAIKLFPVLREILSLTQSKEK